MSRIMGTIEIDFDTDKEINEKLFEEFKNKIEEYIANNLEDVFYDFANKCGFEIESVHPVIMETLVYE